MLPAPADTLFCGALMLSKSYFALFPALVLLTANNSTVHAETASPFANLAGRWVGEGRLGVKDNPAESVKCRATYIEGASADELKQTIRCATAGGAIEVISNVLHAAGALKGHWKETMHNIEGDLDGQVTPAGFRITVRGETLAANMEIIAKADKQVVEIQFHNSTLIGMTLMLKKG